jgi:cell division ATPase FtsA
VDVRLSFLVEVIQARLQEIFEFVAAEIDKAQLLSDLHAGLYIAGGTAYFRGLQQLVEYTTGLAAHIVSAQHLVASGIMDPFNRPDFANLAAILDQAPKLHELALSIAVSLPAADAPPPMQSGIPQKSKPKTSKFFDKIRTYMEKTIRIPNDLID